MFICEKTLLNSERKNVNDDRATFDKNYSQKHIRVNVYFRVARFLFFCIKPDLNRDTTWPNSQTLNTIPSHERETFVKTRIE